MMRRRPIALTDAELYSLLFVSNVAVDDDGMWENTPKREQNSHRRANQKLQREATRRQTR